MCGFFGVLAFRGDVISSKNFLDYALQDLSRRGPDQQGVWEDAHALLGFRRLAIRDLSHAGDQPMVSPNDNFIILYNGEIYNSDELINWAGINVSELKSRSDTEIILLCIEKNGVCKTLERLDGIFALAVYDKRQKSVTLARDRAGVKPLYFGSSNEGVVFSSNYHLVTAHPYFSKGHLQKSALYNYLRYGFIQEGEGLLYNTYNLPHGHFITLSGNSETTWKPYTNLNEFLHHNGVSVKREPLHEVFESVVRSQLVSDVPVGTFLSGGVDSTITSALAARANKNLTAFTIGVDDPLLDETSEAVRFAKNFNLNHVVHKLDEDALSTIIEQYDDCMGEPLADYSSLMTLKVAELAKNEITVALSGDGGDELFWGYPRFKKAAKYVSYYNASAIGRWLRIIAGKLTRKHIPHEVRVHSNFKEYYLSKQSIPGADRWTRLLLNKFTGQPVPYFASALTGDVSTTPLAMRFARALEFHIHLQRVLLKVDRASMYHSLEVRTPILSRPMINLSTCYEYADCVNSTKAKMPLRHLLKSLLPPAEADSGLKKGFEPPLGKWLRGTLKKRFEERLFSIPLLYQHDISKDAIIKMWEEHQSGINNTWMLWSLYSLFTWTDKKMYRTCM
jgi:asparagine synthase (glutamine-hydrolysing)